MTRQDEYRLTATAYLRENSNRPTFELNTHSDQSGQHVLLAEAPLDEQYGLARSQLLGLRHGVHQDGGS
jgi:hypothetical protein